MYAIKVFAGSRRSKPLCNGNSCIPVWLTRGFFYEPGSSNALQLFLRRTLVPLNLYAAFLSPKIFSAAGNAAKFRLLNNLQLKFKIYSYLIMDEPRNPNPGNGG
jgi:hypothetical protein